MFKQIGVNIRTLRKQRKLSQSDIAEKIGVSRQQIANYEKGEATIPLVSVYKLSVIFNISIDSLIIDSEKHIVENGINKSKDKIDYPALTNVFDSEKLGTVISNLVNKKIDERIGDVEDLLYKLLGNMKAKEVEDIVKKELDQVDEIIENGSKVNSK